MQLISNSDISKVEFISTKRQYIKIVIYLNILITKMIRFKLQNDPGRLNQVSVFVNREGVFYGLEHPWPKL
jgi:hypothetical protein